MADNDGYDVRSEMLKLLMSKVAKDTYPSATYLDLIEQMLRPKDVPAYARLLMKKIQSDPYPSISMMNRVMALH